MASRAAIKLPDNKHTISTYPPLQKKNLKNLQKNLQKSLPCLFLSSFASLPISSKNDPKVAENEGKVYKILVILLKA